MKTSSSNIATTPLKKGSAQDQLNVGQFNDGQLSNSHSVEQSSPIQQLSSTEEENVPPQAMNHAHGAQNLTVHNHVHSEESLRKIINRLSRLEGHIRGVKTMVQENRPCPDVLVQVAAVRGGLDRVARIILDEHLSECMTRAAEEGNIAAEIDALKAALDRFIS